MAFARTYGMIMQFTSIYIYKLVVQNGEGYSKRPFISCFNPSRTFFPSSTYTAKNGRFWMKKNLSTTIHKIESMLTSLTLFLCFSQLQRTERHPCLWPARLGLCEAKSMWKKWKNIGIENLSRFPKKVNNVRRVNLGCQPLVVLRCCKPFPKLLEDLCSVAR